MAHLKRYEILDTTPEIAFDRLTALASRLFEVPMALVSLVDGDRLWFKSSHGSFLTEMPRQTSFCEAAMGQEGVFVVEDAALDPRFASHKPVVERPFLRFYAGVPLRDSAGAVLGTLCLLDVRPRQFSAAQCQNLIDLAAVVMDELELHRQARCLEREIAERHAVEQAWRESQARFENAFQHSALGMALVAPGGDYLRVNGCFCEIVGLDEAQITQLNVRDLTHPDDLPATWSAVEQVLSDEVAAVELEKRYRHRDGHAVMTLVNLSVSRDGKDAPPYLIAQVQNISARRQAEDLLRQSEARKAAILDTALDCIIIFDAQNNILEWNPAAERVFGFSRQQAVGRKFHGLVVPPELHEAHAIGMARFLETGEMPFLGQRVEMPALRCDGAKITIEVVIVPALDADAPLFTIHARDVTDQSRIQERLQLLESVAVHANDAILITEAEPITHPGPKILYANEAFLRMTGYELDEIIGQTPRVLHGPDTSDEGRARIREALLKWEPVEVEILNYKKDGTPFWVELSIVPIANASGWFTHWVSIQRDISERRETSDALRQSEGRYGRIAANVPGMVYQFCLRDDGSVTFPFVSEGCREIYGLEPAQVMADAALLMNHVHPDDARDFANSIAVSAQNLSPWQWEGRVSLPGQPMKWIRGSSRATREGDSVVWDGLLFDVTQRKAEEEVLQIAKRDAEIAREEAERANLAKSDFLSRMSHELRTPLNAILGFGQLLEMANLSRDDAQSADQIVKAGRHLLDLINEVLDIARIESGQVSLSPEAVSVREIGLEVLDLVRPLARARGISFEESSIRGANCFIRADRQRLKQVLLNLLSNAVKYNREGGTVAFSCHIEGGGDGSGNGGEDGESSCVRIAVADSGIGIDPSLRHRLFTPFDRLGAERSDVEGTGMGLALSRRLAEAMGGQLDFHSTLEQGSTFWIELPEAADPLRCLEPLAPPGDAQAEVGTRLVVLYIEDNPSNLQLVQRLLSHRPEIRLLTAMQGGLGYELARQHTPDVILLDINLPDVGGDVVIRQLRADEKTRHIPVIVVSADATPGQIQRLLQAGAHRYLTKPFDVRELLSLLDENIRLNSLLASPSVSPAPAQRPSPALWPGASPTSQKQAQEVGAREEVTP